MVTQKKGNEFIISFFITYRVNTIVDNGII